MSDNTEQMREALEAALNIVADKSVGGRMITTKEQARAVLMKIKDALSGRPQPTDAQQDKMPTASGHELLKEILPGMVEQFWLTYNEAIQWSAMPDATGIALQAAMGRAAKPIGRLIDDEYTRGVKRFVWGNYYGKGIPLFVAPSLPLETSADKDDGSITFFGGRENEFITKMVADEPVGEWVSDKEWQSEPVAPAVQEPASMSSEPKDCYEYASLIERLRRHASTTKFPPSWGWDEAADAITQLQQQVEALKQKNAALSSINMDDMVLRGIEIECQADEIARLKAELASMGSEAQFDFRRHLARQAAWSEKTFGPGMRTAGVCDHIRKEIKEIEIDPSDLREWVDVVILALDGAWRCGGSPSQIIEGIVAKQAKNEGRSWPDWRTADPNKAIEHDRTGETITQSASSAPATAENKPAQPVAPLRAVKIAVAVAALPIGGAAADMPTPFQSGFQLACEEIIHRLKTEEWDLCLKPEGKDGGKVEDQ